MLAGARPCHRIYGGAGYGSISPASSWRVAMEPREPFHWLGRRTSVSTRDRGGQKCRTETPVFYVRSCFHLCAAARERNSQVGPRYNRSGEHLHCEGQGSPGTDVRRPTGIEQGRNGEQIW